MEVTVFNGSPRPRGNTSALVERIVEGLKAGGVGGRTVTLYDKDLRGCSNCGACQRGEVPGFCTMEDDMQDLYRTFLEADTVLIASPVYMWQLTPCTLAFLNRLHALKAEGRNLMKGKGLALAVTMGDGSECADSAVMGIIDFCEYFGMDFLGMVRIPYAERGQILDGTHDERIGSFVDRLCAAVRSG